MSEGGGLKRDNNKYIAASLAGHIVILVLVAGVEVGEQGGLGTLAKYGGIALAASVLAAVANHLVSSELKARLVFLRWRNPYPGCRAFSYYVERDSRIDVAQEVLNRTEEIPRIEGLLESAFPVRESWMDGELTAYDIVIPDITDLESLLDESWRHLLDVYQIEEVRTSTPRRRAGTAYLQEGVCLRRADYRADSSHRLQPFELELRSEVMGSHTLLRCISPVGVLDLSNRAMLDRLYELQRKLGMVKVCASHDVRSRHYRVSVQGHQLFHMKTTQLQEIERLMLSIVESADRLERELLQRDAEAQAWLERDRGDIDG